MGREVRRVPLNFEIEHPIGEIWPGYLRSCDNDECDGCADCESVDPPEGEGWQLWETTSEGSPITPVFADGEALAQHMSRSPVGFAGSSITLEDARRWVLGSDWSPSMIASGGVLMDGITAMARREDE